MSDPIQVLASILNASPYKPGPSAPKAKTGTVHPSWLPIKMSTVSDQRPETKVLFREDNVCLLYPGRIHMLFGDGGSLKSWIALLAIVQEVKQGRAGIFIDYEDNEVGMKARLRDLGLTDDEMDDQFLYIFPQTEFDEDVEDAIKALLKHMEATHPVTVVVIDAMNEAMGMEELDPNTAIDVVKFYNRYAKKIASMGPAVVIIDHVNKTKLPGEKSNAGGSVHKRNGIDGVQYEVKNTAGFGYGRHGKSIIINNKDRAGGIGQYADRGEAIGTFHIDATLGGAYKCWIEVPGIMSATVVTNTPSGTVSTRVGTYAKVCKAVKAGQTNKKLINDSIREEFGSGVKSVELGAVIGSLERLGCIKNAGTEGRPKYEFVTEFDPLTMGEDDDV
jgi:hypothetical protein